MTSIFSSTLFPIEKGSHIISQEASTLQLAPGVFPSVVVLDPPIGNNRPFVLKRACASGTHIYWQTEGDLVLSILND